jgi:hypothetical protein
LINEQRNKTKRFEGLTRLGASIGVLCWLAWCIYSLCLWKVTPELPDQDHVVEWIEHGRAHYLTAYQHSFFSNFKTVAFVGLAAFVVLAATHTLSLRKNETDHWQPRQCSGVIYQSAI